MNPRRILTGALLVLASMVVSKVGHAEAPAACRERVTRATVVPCALARSLAVRAEQHAVEAARGREITARAALPSNPVLSVSLGVPTLGPDRSRLTWSGSLAQEVEIGGQREARIEIARAEAKAELTRARLTEREIAEGALVAYFEAIAAREELALAGRLSQVAQALSAAASARAEQGLASPLDADVAYAGAMRLQQMRATAERRASAAAAAIAGALGLDPSRESLAVEGDLVPLRVAVADPAALAEQAVSARAEIASAEILGAVNERRAALLRRARVPNLTVSIFAQNDSVNDRVVGGGLALPIPLPGPVGHMNAGEIAEATSLARRAETEAERLKRQVRVEVATAAQALASRQREVEAFDPKRLARALEGLTALGQELTRGSLSVRDALLAEQALIDLLEAHLEARRALCIASVELARAAGIALDRGAL